MILVQVVFVFNLLVADLHCQELPCFPGWLYSKLNGKCYLAGKSMQSQSEAAISCTKSVSMSLTPKLIRVDTINDGLAVAEQMISIANNEEYWMDAKYDDNSKSWQWSDKTPFNTTLLNAFLVSSGQMNKCLKFKYFFSNSGTTYERRFQLLKANCSEIGYFVCEHNTPPCDPDKIPFNSDNMQFVPDLKVIYSYVYVACLPGFYRPSELQPTQTVQGIQKNYAFCTMVKKISTEPPFYDNQWNVSTIEQCQPVSCPPFNGTLSNVVSQILPVSPTNAYAFGFAFNVSCLRGYVSHTNNKMLTSALTCQQSLIDKSTGIWTPYDYTPCVPIQCNFTTLNAMTPMNSAILSARNKISQKEYTSLQMSFFALFNNIVTFQCNYGYFFPDRSYSKQVICDLANDSLITGDWKGYSGTILPLPPSCQNATCQYESIVISPNMNLEPIFMMMNSAGSYENQTNPTGDPYPFQTRLRFACKNGFSTGIGNTQQDLDCGPHGIWIPNLTPCMAIIKPLDLKNAQHYVPPAQEAQSAQEIGSVAIVILIIFLSLILVLDLSTASRDFKLLKGNIEQLGKVIKNKN